MLKTILVFLLGLTVWNCAEAQKADTVSFYIDNQQNIVNTKDSADHILQIMTPPYNSAGVKINRVNEYYLSGQPKILGSADIRIYGRHVNILRYGACIYYYPNGHKETIGFYKNNMPIGNITRYYPNGKLYTILINDGRPKFIECRDSTGNILAQNGNGKLIKFDRDFYMTFKHKTSEGMIKDSLEDGEWQTFVNDSAKYTLVYKHGILISSTEPGWKDKIFMAVETEPNFKNGGSAGLNAFLAKTVVFPSVDREMGTQGKVIVTFVVEKNGTLSGVRTLRAPSQSMAAATIEALQRSPAWIPGMQDGKPVRVQYTISFSFSLAKN